MLRNVAAVVLDGVEPFELGVVCEVFGTDRSDDGLPVYDFAVVAGEPGPLRTSQGFTLSTPHGLDRLAAADLIAVPALTGSRVEDPSQLPAPLLAELRRGVDRGARVLSVCNGAFVLGSAGLLDDRRCTTHWHQTDALARLFPAAKVGLVPVRGAAARASTPACTWSARSTAARSPTRSPGGWWSRRTATAARPSTSTGPWPGSRSTPSRT